MKGLKNKVLLTVVVVASGAVICVCTAILSRYTGLLELSVDVGNNSRMHLTLDAREPKNEPE